MELARDGEAAVKKHIRRIKSPLACELLRRVRDSSEIGGEMKENKTVLEALGFRQPVRMRIVFWIGAQLVGAVAPAGRRAAEKDAQEAARRAREGREETRGRDDHAYRAIVAEQFISKYTLRIKPECLMGLARAGEAAVEEYIRRSKSPLACELRQELAAIRRLKGEVGEIGALMDVIEKGAKCR